MSSNYQLNRLGLQCLYYINSETIQTNTKWGWITCSQLILNLAHVRVVQLDPVRDV